MRSSETFGFVPGARIVAQVPPDGVFNGWNFFWVRGTTPIQYFENEEMLVAALSGAYTGEALCIPELLFNENGISVGENSVWDGGTPNQFFEGYFAGEVPGGWASWANVNIANDALYSPETRDNVPGMYLPELHYSLRRFTSYLDVDCSCYRINSAHLVSAFTDTLSNQSVFPLNDSIFVFVNGRMAYWAASDLIGSGNVAQNRLIFNGMTGIRPNRSGEFIFTDGWYLSLGDNAVLTNIAPYLRHGRNVIDVITDDYYFGGGMARIDIRFNTSPVINNRNRRFLC